ncbi:MAG: hypothetical protein ACLSUL_09605 [[Ruminococcus] torques]
MDEKVLKKFVKKNVKKCVPVRRMQVSMENGEFVYTDSQEGHIGCGGDG